MKDSASHFSKLKFSMPAALHRQSLADQPQSSCIFLVLHSCISAPLQELQVVEELQLFPVHLISIRVLGSQMLRICRSHVGWKGKLAEEKSQWTPLTFIHKEPPYCHALAFTAESIRREYPDGGKRKQGLGKLGGGWDARSGGKEAQLQSSTEGRKAGVSSRDKEKKLPAALVKEQNNTCQWQRQLSTEWLRTGRENVLAPNDHILPCGETLGDPCY